MITYRQCLRALRKICIELDEPNPMYALEYVGGDWAAFYRGRSAVIEAVSELVRWDRPDLVDTFYDGPAWRALRYDVLEASKGRCECCGRSAAADAVTLHVDHIQPRSRAPDLALERSNLQVLCEDCNLGKGNRYSTDSAPPKRVKLRLLIKYGGRCYRTGHKFRPGDPIEFDHIRALCNGGENRETNLAPILGGKVHQAKTRADVEERVKTDRLRAKHLGLWPEPARKIQSRGFSKRSYP